MPAPRPARIFCENVIGCESVHDTGFPRPRELSGSRRRAEDAEHEEDRLNPAYSGEPMPHGTPFPLPLSAYPDLPGETLRAILATRVHVDPFNAVATGIFLLAVLHTFFAARFTFAAHALQARKDAAAIARGLTPRQALPRSCCTFSARSR